MNQIVDELILIVGKEFVFTDENTRQEYGHDETEDLNFPPMVVVKPANTDEVSTVSQLHLLVHGQV
jgi:glycolate oxidase